MLAAIGHALIMAATMAWEILWALILGFFLSAVVQAVSVKRGDVAPPAGRRAENTLEGLRSGRRQFLLLICSSRACTIHV